MTPYHKKLLLLSSQSLNNSSCICYIVTCCYLLHSCDSLIELALLVVCNAKEVVDATLGKKNADGLYLSVLPIRIFFC